MDKVVIVENHVYLTNCCYYVLAQKMRKANPRAGKTLTPARPRQSI